MAAYAYLSPTVGKILLEYAPGEEAGLDELTAREVVAQYAMDGQPVPVDFIDKAKVEMEALRKIQTDRAVKEEMEGLIENLEYLSKAAKKKAKANPNIRPFSLKGQVGAQRKSKARRGAKGSSRQRKVAKEVRKKRVSKVLSKLNPGPSTALFNSVYDIVATDINAANAQFVGLDAEDVAEEVLYGGRYNLPLSRGRGIYDSKDLELATTAVIDARYRTYKGIGKARELNPWVTESGAHFIMPGLWSYKKHHINIESTKRKGGPPYVLDISPEVRVEEEGLYESERLAVEDAIEKIDQS